MAVRAGVGGGLGPKGKFLEKSKNRDFDLAKGSIRTLRHTIKIIARRRAAKAVQGSACECCRSVVDAVGA